MSNRLEVINASLLTLQDALAENLRQHDALAIEIKKLAMEKDELEGIHHPGEEVPHA